METSALVATCTVAVSVLLARLGSGVAELTWATSVSGPKARPEARATVTVMLAVAGAAMVPRLHKTWPVPGVHDPTEGLADTRVVPVGSESVTAVDTAGDGPALVTVKV